MPASRSWSVALAIIGAGLILLVGRSSAVAATQMEVQPSGQIVVAGYVWPEAGAIARLQANGNLDPTFGEDGFMLDPRLGTISALALSAGGRIAAGSANASQLARYLADGSADAGFGTDGLVRTGDLGPQAIVPQPAGTLAVASDETHGGGDTDAWVERYDETGKQLETVGHLPLPGRAGSSVLTDLLEARDGSLVGVGWHYPGSPEPTTPLLARFVPGAGTGFDPGFGNGAGLVRPVFPSRQGFTNAANAAALDGQRLLVAGEAAGSFFVARFEPDGTPDSSFGHDGVSVPPIGPPEASQSETAKASAGSSAIDVVRSPDGKVLVAGGSSEWGEWEFTKAGPQCSGCPQAVLARLDAGGDLDPSFGTGGVLKMTDPDGTPLAGAVEEAIPSPDGKILVSGSIPSAAWGATPFVARLNADGSFDPSFGASGMTILRFPCTSESQRQKVRSGCSPSAQVSIRLRGASRGRPSLSLRARPRSSWAAIRELSITLPRQLRLSKSFRSGLRVLRLRDPEPLRLKVGTIPPGHRSSTTTLLLQGLGRAGEVLVRLAPGSLRAMGPWPRQGAKVRLSVQFSHANRADEAGYQELARRIHR